MKWTLSSDGWLDPSSVRVMFNISNDDPNTLIIREGNNLEQKCKKVFTPKERKLEEKNLKNDLKPMST